MITMSKDEWDKAHKMILGEQKEGPGRLCGHEMGLKIIQALCKREKACFTEEEFEQAVDWADDIKVKFMMLTLVMAGKVQLQPHANTEDVLIAMVKE